MKNIILYVVMIVFLFSCSSAEELTLERVDYTGTNLRIDGYYYHSNASDYTTFLLYQNGVYLALGSFPNISSLSVLDGLHDNKVKEECDNLYYCWGVFKVENNTIVIERWLPGNGGAYPVQLLEGEILNDTTILISGLRGAKYEDEVDEFKFRHLSPKPDSTNMFIK